MNNEKDKLKEEFDRLDFIESLKNEHHYQDKNYPINIFIRALNNI